MVLGAALGFAWGRARDPGICAEAVLYFPTDPNLTRFSLPEATPTPGGSSQTWDKRTWAVESLQNKKCIDWVCNSIVQRELQPSRELIHSAVLLLDEKRLRTERFGEGSLRLRVRAAQPQVALVLCQQLVLFLNKAANQELIDRARELASPADQEVARTGRELQKQEQRLASEWFAYVADSTNRKEEPLAVTLDYFTTLGVFRKNLAQRFFGKLDAEYDAPAFLELDPPAIVHSWNWPLVLTLAGAATGLFGGAVLRAVIRRPSFRVER